MRVVKLKKMKRINGVHYAPDGGRLLVCGGAEVRGVDEGVWIDVVNGVETGRIDLFADCYAVTHDLTKVARGGPRGKADEVFPPLVWLDPEDGKQLHPVELQLAPGYREFFGLAFDPTGKRLATSFMTDTDGRRDRLVVATLDRKGRTIEMPTDNAPVCNTIAFSHKGKQIALSGGLEGDPDVIVISSKNFEPLYEFTPKGTCTRQLVYSPDGGTLAVVNGRNVYLLPADSTEPRLILGDHPKQVNAVAFSPDGRRLLSACHDKLVRVWDAASGQLIQKYDWGLGAMTAIAFAPDGLTAAAGGEKGQVVFWDVDG